MIRTSNSHYPDERVSDGVSRRGTPPKEEDVARGRTQRAATVGVAEHGNSAVLVTVAAGWYDRERPMD
jgi:hypothetical protein